MAIEGSSDLVTKIETALGSSSSLLEVGELEFAASQSLNELGWDYPIETPKKIYWTIQRGKRHAIDILRVQAARKFQFKNLSLQHTFRHYHDLIQEMDNDFQKALNEDMELMGIPFEGMFGLSVENGIVYDQFGNDISKLLGYYNVDNEGFRHRII